MLFLKGGGVDSIFNIPLCFCLLIFCSSFAPKQIGKKIYIYMTFSMPQKNKNFQHFLEVSLLPWDIFLKLAAVVPTGDKCLGHSVQTQAICRACNPHVTPGSVSPSYNMYNKFPNLTPPAPQLYTLYSP